MGGEPKEETWLRNGPSGKRRVLARTRNRLDTGNGNGNRLAIEAGGN